MCVRAILHLEAGAGVGPKPLEFDCTKFQPSLGLSPSSTTHYYQIIIGGNSPICKGFEAKKRGRFNKIYKNLALLSLSLSLFSWPLYT